MALTRYYIGFSTINQPPFQYRVYDIELVKRDLLNEFNTRQGERLMLPNYGSIAWDLLFEPFTTDVQNQLLQNSTDIINKDPRVNLISITADESIDLQYITITAVLQFIPSLITDTLYINFTRNQPGS